ncbi:MAG TPA: sulfatase-modifying factor protein [Planctomycetaceae bacterium]|nr:sulfatase-modifying factor protein [Planctomycetaceae bacterium]
MCRSWQAVCLLAVSLAVSSNMDHGVRAAENEADSVTPQPAANDFDPSEVPAVKWLPSPRPVKDVDAKESADMKPYTEEIVGTEVTFDMVPIPGGQFTMGSPDDEADRKDDEGPQREVSIGPFWMGKCEVTWTEYELWAMGLDLMQRDAAKHQANPYDKLADAIARPSMPYCDMTFGMGKKDYPAICMTQLAAKMYCKWLSAKTGRYYRLPTEAEWEYACRAGTNTAYSFGDDPEDIDDYAWHYDNSDEQYQKIGKKKPNPWGLYDMHGNVAEWVLDQYTPRYEKGDGGVSANPLIIPKELYPRTVRGGSWDDDPEALRSAARRGSHKDWSMQDCQIPQSIWYHTDATFVGFRVVRPLTAPTAEEAKAFEPEIEFIREYKEAQSGKE